jgi:gluconolactonase
LTGIIALLLHCGVILTVTLPSILVSAAEPNSTTATFGRIIRLDPRIDKLIPEDAVLEKIADGFSWVEGPVWISNGQYLLFSDIPNNSVYKGTEGEGVSLFLRPSGYAGKTPFKGKEPSSNGLTIDSQGRLVLCEHGDRRISRLETDGIKTTLVDRYDGTRLNNPNDLVYKSNGDLYFTDPPLGLPTNFEDPMKELHFQGVYRLSNDGKLTLLAENIKAPNGIAFSLDEKTLYITDVDPDRPAWLAYDVRADGTITNGLVFFDASSWKKPNYGCPDGLEVDSEGNLFAARPGGVNVFAPDGTLLGFIETGVPTSNVAWGEDGSVLYITANTAVYRIKLNSTGAGF